MEVVVSRCRLWNLLECMQAMRESSYQLEEPQAQRRGVEGVAQVRGVEAALSLLLFQGRSWHQKAPEQEAALEINSSIYKAEKETQAQRTSVWIPRRKAGSEVNWEAGIYTHTPPMLA